MFSTEIGLIENLTTAGADDLIDFLKGFIVGLAILMFERIYFNYLLDYIYEKVKNLILEIIKFLKNIF